MRSLSPSKAHIYTSGLEESGYSEAMSEENNYLMDYLNDFIDGFDQKLELTEDINESVQTS